MVYEKCDLADFVYVVSLSLNMTSFNLFHIIKKFVILTMYVSDFSGPYRGNIVPGWSAVWRAFLGLILS